VPPTAAPAPPAPPPAARRYTVASGDSLRSIAAKFNVTVDALLQANNLTKAQGDALRVGQELVIP
jgi:LysM repeat protein